MSESEMETDVEELTISIQSGNVISELSIMLFSIMILVHITSQYTTKFSMAGCPFFGGDDDGKEWREYKANTRREENISNRAAESQKATAVPSREEMKRCWEEA